MGSKYEVLIVRMECVNKTGKRIDIGEHFAPLFRCNYLDPGRYTIRFPILSREYKQLATEFQEAFPELKVDFGSNRIEEY